MCLLVLESLSQYFIVTGAVIRVSLHETIGILKHCIHPHISGEKYTFESRVIHLKQATETRIHFGITKVNLRIDTSTSREEVIFENGKFTIVAFELKSFSKEGMPCKRIIKPMRSKFGGVVIELNCKNSFCKLGNCGFFCRGKKCNLLGDEPYRTVNTQT